MSGIGKRKFDEERASGIGGSDAAAVCNMDPYRTPVDVYKQKIGLLEEDSDSIHIRRGIELEPWALEEYQRSTDLVVATHPDVRRHPEHPELIVHLDGLIGAKEENEAGALEVKCPSLQNFYAIKRGGANAQMIFQLQHGMNVARLSWGEFAIFHPDVGVHSFEMQRDDELIAMMVEVELTFWEVYVKKEKPPPADYALDALESIDLPDVPGEVRAIDGERWRELAHAYVEADEVAREAKAWLGSKDGDAYTGVKGEIAAFLQKHDLEAVEGPVGQDGQRTLRVYYREQKGRVTRDWEALTATQPLDPALVQEKLMELVGKPRKVDAQTIIEELKDCRLDLSRFETRGDSFRTLRAYIREES